VRLSLDHGADVNISSLALGEEGLTPYQVATKHGHHDVARLLLEHSPGGKPVESDTDTENTTVVRLK
jgi:ankyrin repeat protein